VDYFSGTFRDDFKQFLMLKGYSPQTIETTVYFVRRCVNFLKTAPPQVGAADIDTWLIHLIEDRGYGVHSLCVVIQSLKRFFRYLHRSGGILSDPSNHLPSPRTGYSMHGDLLSCDDMDRIRWSITGQGFLACRDRAILEVLYATALRVSELSSLNCDDVDLFGKVLRIRKGKGGRDRQAVVTDPAVAALRVYLSHRPQQPESALFLNNLGNRISSQGIRKKLKTLARRAGVNARSNPHAWRHALATALLRRGASIAEIQGFLGHASIRTTQIYTHILIRELKRIHAISHPREHDFEELERTAVWIPTCIN